MITTTMDYKNARIKTMLTKHRILKTQQKQVPQHSKKGATNLPPISESFLYVETSGRKYGQNVSLVLRKRLLSKSVKLPFTTKDSLQAIASRWVALEINSY